MKTTILSVSLLVCYASAHEHHSPKEEKETSSSAVATPEQEVLTGKAPFLYKNQIGWAKNPNKQPHLGSTHGGIAIDKTGNVYVNTDTKNSIIVFSPEGEILRTFGADHVGIHDICIIEEEGEEFLYAAYLKGKSIVKFKLNGDLVWEIKGPPPSGAYRSKKQYNPTSVAVAPNGDIYVADGYGLNFIHRYNKKREYLGSFGGKGKGNTKFMTCHGVAIDNRDPGNPLLLVCDRENRCIKRFSLEGTFIDVPISGLRRPCSVSTWDDKLAVAELEGRAVILDKDFKILSALGDNPNKKEWAKFHVSPPAWKPNIFTAPHSCQFDANGNLYIMDWNKTGRIRKFLLQK